MTSEQGNTLLRIARDSIGETLGEGKCVIPNEPWLDRPAATFVTLMKRGELKGCIGSVEAYRSLGEDVRENAQAAAFHDPRFSPLTEEEFPMTKIEVSVLTSPEPIEFNDEKDALAQLRPGIDGIILECGRRKSTFLPQVWENLSEPAQFLSHLKEKAGLSTTFWSPDIRLFRYECEKWKEE